MDFKYLYNMQSKYAGLVIWPEGSCNEGAAGQKVKQSTNAKPAARCAKQTIQSARTGTEWRFARLRHQPSANQPTPMAAVHDAVRYLACDWPTPEHFHYASKSVPEWVKQGEAREHITRELTLTWSTD